MAVPVRLEFFDQAEEAARYGWNEKLDDARFQAYERGYTSGWDDSVQAQEQAHQHISADFARSLQEVSFTYHEARSHVLEGLRPILSEMTSKVLPSVAKSTFAETVSEIVLAHAAEDAEAPLECAVAQDNRALLDRLVEGQTSAPVTVVADPGVGTGEAHLRSGKRETQYNADRLLTEIHAAVDAFFESDRKVESR